jgi:2-amino-4-hydroxy-6-hydroxymethyldihydropteridine diphosphokinase
MVTCYIGIGSNLGDRKKYIERAIEELKKSGRIDVKRVSSVYETEPMGDVAQGKFLNGVIEADTDFSPHELLSELNSIENGLGRKRIAKNGPRTIDLDILYYGSQAINEKDLVIPHPKIEEREFVLKGLRELGMA